MSTKLTKVQVLAAIPKAAAPDTAYIADQLARDGFAAWRPGLRDRPRQNRAIYRHLNELVADGFVTKSTFSNGYYGFRWTLTEAGRAALSALPCLEEGTEPRTRADE